MLQSYREGSLGNAAAHPTEVDGDQRDSWCANK